MKIIKYALIAAGLFFLYSSHGVRDLFRNYIDLKKLNQRHCELKNEQENLKKEIELLSTKDEYIEKAARKQLGLVKRGEIEYRFPPPAPETNDNKTN